MVWLGLDASWESASAALFFDGGHRAERVMATRHPAEALVRQVLRPLLAAEGVRGSDLRGVAAGMGPGSFTGVRVALSVGKGLALAHGVPLVGVPSLRALVEGAIEPGAWCVTMVDASRGEAYAALFRCEGAQWAAVGEPLVAPPRVAGETLRARAPADSEIVLVGAGPRILDDALRGLGPSVRLTGAGPRSMALLIAELARRGDAIPDLGGLEPAYVRPPDARLPTAARS